MRLIFFGTYEPAVSPRIQVLKEGLAASGHEVLECTAPLGADTAARVRILHRPWLVPLLLARVALAWTRLLGRARRLPPPDAVVVGYMGHFDVHLARRLWRRTPLVLDHLIFAGDTALDRRVSSGHVVALLDRLDRAAVRTADIVCVDTEAHRELLPEQRRSEAIVVPVGASGAWFHAPRTLAARPLRIVFFGFYTPLQGAPVIGAAIRLLADAGAPVSFTMIGRGQDTAATRAAAGENAPVRWLDWVEPDALPAVVAGHHVCLGIFGTGSKARNVVPNKVFQGAAAATAIVTSDTPPQRSALGDAAVLVPYGDAGALAHALAALADDPERVEALRAAAHRRAEEAFRPVAAVAPLRARLAGSGETPA